MTAAITAWREGIIQVLKAPGLVLAVLIVTIGAAAPFALVVRGQLQSALANQPPIALGSGEIDADWWSEFRQHAEGLAATFTPTVIGFAAPLDNLSAVLDGTSRPLALVAPAAIAIVLWAMIWGVALRRFHARGSLSVREGVAAGLSTLPRFVVISLVAAAIQLLLYLTIHRVLFGMVYSSLVAESTAEPTAFAIRVVLYLIFGSLIVSVSLVADYARVAQIVLAPAGLGEMFGMGLRFVRQHFASVAMLYVLTGLLFVALMAGYGVVDIVGGSRVGGWRGVLLGQAFIIGRLAVRLISGASQVALVKALRN
jgi:hypothetical protein